MECRNYLVKHYKCKYAYQKQYCSYAVYSWYASVVTAGAGNLQEPKIARAGLVRTTRALVELDPLGSLNGGPSS